LVRINVPPRQTLDIPYTVAIPDSLSATGSFWSMVMVETVPRGSAESSIAPAARQPTVAIASRFRYAIQVVTNIDSAITRDAQFLEPTALVTRDSSKGLQFDLKNTGNLAFVPKFTVELYAMDGTHVNTFTALRELTYPGNSFRQQFNFGRLAHGKYRTIVTLDAGNDALFGAQYTFTF
jgi:hypothetical protein